MHSDVETRAAGRIGRRLIPFLALLYFAAFLDRVNVGFAALQMNRDLGLSAHVYGFGAGIFFLGYCLFEVPSNLLLHRLGGRRWLSRIMLTWGLIAGATAFVQGGIAFCVLRFLLGVAEAGFFPGVIYYLTHWVPAARRAHVVGGFMAAIPVSTAIGGPLSGAILGLDGTWGIAGWQWLYVLETVPSLLLGVATYLWLPDTPRDARWLPADEREWLLATLETERRAAPPARGLAATLTDPRVLLLGLCYSGIQVALYGVILWVPQILRGAGLGEAQVGLAVAVPYAVAALAMVLWSRRSDRQGERRWHLAGAAAFAAAGLVATALLGDSPRLAILAVSVSAAGTLAVLPIFWTLPTAWLKGAPAAAAIALINAIGNVGGFIGPYLIGWLKDATGAFAPGLYVAAIGALATGAIALVIGARPQSVESPKSL